MNGYDADSPCFQSGGTCNPEGTCLTLSTGDTTCTSCADACGTECCDGTNACLFATACIKKDGSCNGDLACLAAGDDGNTQLQISGPSCVGIRPCYFMYAGSQNNMVVKLTRSCLCENSCFSHCQTDVAVGGLPACGESLCNIVGISGFDGCKTPSTETCEVSLCLATWWSGHFGQYLFDWHGRLNETTPTKHCLSHRPPHSIHSFITFDTRAKKRPTNQSLPPRCPAPDLACHLRASRHLRRVVSRARLHRSIRVASQARRRHRSQVVNRARLGRLSRRRCPARDLAFHRRPSRRRIRVVSRARPRHRIQAVCRARPRHRIQAVCRARLPPRCPAQDLARRRRTSHRLIQAVCRARLHRWIRVLSRARPRHRIQVVSRARLRRLSRRRYPARDLARLRRTSHRLISLCSNELSKELLTPSRRSRINLLPIRLRPSLPT